jgi:lipopolysaccharide transport system ATP-binding protein
LIVDEVLAVGDAQFQKKCLGKMEDVSGEGRTVIFVSHQMDAIQRLCSSCIWLSSGELLKYDSARSVIHEYSSTGIQQTKPDVRIDISKVRRTSGNKEAFFSAIKYSVSNSVSDRSLYPDCPLSCELEIESNSDRIIRSIGVSIYDVSGPKLINFDTATQGQEFPIKKGTNKFEFSIESLHLKPGSYTLGLWLANPMGDTYDYIENAIQLDIISDKRGTFGSELKSGLSANSDGVVTAKCKITQYIHAY